jgi:hypothetical protein
LLKIAPVLYNAALMAHLDRLGIPGGPLDFDKLSQKTFAEYLDTHSGITDIQNGLEAAGGLD